MKKDYKTEVETYVTEDGLPTIEIKRTMWLGSISFTFSGKDQLNQLRDAINKILGE